MANPKVPSSKLSRNAVMGQLSASLRGDDELSQWMERMHRSTGNTTAYAKIFGDSDEPSTSPEPAMRAALPKQESGGAVAGDPERAARVMAASEAKSQEVVVHHLSEQSKLLRDILDQLKLSGRGGPANSIGGLAEEVADLLPKKTISGAVKGLVEAAAGGLRRAGNAGMLSGALDGGAKGALKYGGGRLLSMGGAGLAKVASSGLLEVLGGPIGYGLMSAATGAWTAGHESKQEMERKYGKGNDTAGHRVIEAGRQGLSDASFGLSEFAINEIAKHVPGAGKAVDAVAATLDHRIDSVRGLWNPEAREREKKRYGTESGTKAMIESLTATMTGGLSDLFVGKTSPFGQQLDRVGDAVSSFSASVTGKDGLIDQISDSFSSAFAGFDWGKTSISDLATRSANAVARAVTGDQHTTAAAETHKLVVRGQQAAQKTHDFASNAATKTVEAATNLKDWALGKTSQKFESGKSGAGTVSTGAGDAGGASYGTYQMSSKKGVVQDFIKQSDHAKDFAGLQPGSAAFNDKWKQVSASDSKFGDAQHAFIKKTHFDPQEAKLQKAGIDLTKRGAAVQDALWSTSVQFGGNTSVVQDALKGKDVNKMSDADIVKAVQGYKVANNDSLFKSSSANVRAGTLKREQAEQSDLLKLAAADDAAKAKPDYATPAGANTKDVAVAATKTATPDAVRGGDFSPQEVATAAAEIKKNGGSPNLTPAQRAAVDTSARVAGNSLPPGVVDPANVAKGYQSNGIDWGGAGFNQPARATAQAQPNMDVRAAAQASSAPPQVAATPAAEPEQTAAAGPASESPKGVPSDISSVGLLLFNTSVFS